MPIKKIELVSKFENPLLYRTEYVFRIDHEGHSTPSREEVRKTVSERLGVPFDLIVVRKIRTEYGVNVSLAEVFVYTDKEKMLKIEPEHILIRNKIIQPKEEK